MRNLLLASLLLAGCYKSGPTQTPPPAKKSDVRVELASVNLGDDCGDTAEAKAGAPAEAQDIPPGGDTASSFACIPTAMQLSVAGLGLEPSSIRVKRVELLDAQGNVLDDMTPRAPTRWDEKASTYAAWNQVVNAGETVNASYVLAGLDWNKVPGGRWSSQGKTFTVRVTLAVGAEGATTERTVEKAATMPAMIEPDVVT